MCVSSDSTDVQTQRTKGLIFVGRASQSTDSFICISAGVQHLAGVQSPNTERDGNQPVCWNRQLTQESWTLQQAREERSKVKIRMCVLECVCEGLKRVKRLVSRSSSSAPVMIFLHIPLPFSFFCPSLAVFLLFFFYLSFDTFFLCFSVFVLFFQSDDKKHQTVSVLNISAWFLFSLKMFLLR